MPIGEQKRGKWNSLRLPMAGQILKPRQDVGISRNRDYGLKF